MTRNFLLKKARTATIANGPSLYYVSKWTGWVGSKIWQFVLTFSIDNTDVGRVGQKKSKNVLT